VVTQGPEEGQTIVDPNTGNPIFQGIRILQRDGQHCRRHGDFSMVDLTSVQQGTFGMTDLLGANNWGAFEPAFGGAFRDDPGRRGQRGTYFTFHTSGGSLHPSSVAGPGQPTPSQPGLLSYAVSGTVGIGETFWLTRDIDGHSSPHRQMLVTDQVVDWRQGYDLPARNMQTLISAAGRTAAGITLSVHHADGFVTYLYIAPWNSYNGNYLVSITPTGRLNYYYTDFLADVDGTRRGPSSTRV